MIYVRNVVTLLLAALLVGSPALARAEPVPVVATFSILGDLVRNVGGERVSVTTLVGPDGDAHVYSPSPADARRLSEAKLVVTNGLGFEGWLDRLIRSSGTKAAVAEASRGIEPIPAAEDEQEHGHGHGKGKHSHAKHDHGEVDPHAWQDVGRVKAYVTNIRDALITADPDGRADYEKRAETYLAELDRLDREISDKVATIPAERRRVITSHDSFGYFERAYGLDFVAPQGVSTESEASARDIGRIIRQIKAEKIGAVFLENVSNPRLTERIAKETGARIGGRLYSDALSGPDGDAGTYIDMMRHNIRTLSEALAR